MSHGKKKSTPSYLGEREQPRGLIAEEESTSFGTHMTGSSGSHRKVIICRKLCYSETKRNKKPTFWFVLDPLIWAGCIELKSNKQSCLYSHCIHTIFTHLENSHAALVSPLTCCVHRTKLDWDGNCINDWLDVLTLLNPDNGVSFGTKKKWSLKPRKGGMWIKVP